MNQQKIAICFFGITRSLKFTIDSIEECVLSPAREAGEVKVFSHFFKQNQIHNRRSGEIGMLDIDEHRLLASDWIVLEEPDECLALNGFEALKKFGDCWGDEFSSLRNLIHQLHSLDQVTNKAIEWDADIYLFVRPDLQYHDSLQHYVQQTMENSEPVLLIPDWQHGYGYNDRFAICRSKAVAAVYGSRINSCLEYCINRKEPLHAESLLEYSLGREGITPKPMEVRASRVRSNGSVRVEDFSGKRFSKLRKRLRHVLLRLRIMNLLPRMLRRDFRIRHRHL